MPRGAYRTEASSPEREVKHLLVVGASGVIGSAVVEYACRLPGWQVHALSRRPPDLDPEAQYERIVLDLTRPAECEEALRQLKARVTHLVYAAVSETPGLVAGWTDSALMQRNLEMLQNVLRPLSGSPSLRHVVLMQGTKAYGAHLHPIALPAIEDAPRDAHQNFYWLQEDFLRETSAQEGWSWTVLRPQIVLGGACGVAMNPTPVIGAYAAICREEGSACGFPGAHVAIWEAVDARLVAQACIWAFEQPHARNEIFNITNGDVWVPGHQWAAICGILGVPVGPPAPVDFSRFALEKSQVWDRIARRNGLRRIGLAELFGESHHYFNLLMCNGQPAAPWPPALVSTIKIRQAGFAPCLSTFESLRYWLGRLARRGSLPAAPPQPTHPEHVA